MNLEKTYEREQRQQADRFGELQQLGRRETMVPTAGFPGAIRQFGPFLWAALMNASLREFPSERLPPPTAPKKPVATE